MVMVNKIMNMHSGERRRVKKGRKSVDSPEAMIGP